MKPFNYLAFALRFWKTKLHKMLIKYLVAQVVVICVRQCGLGLAIQVPNDAQILPPGLSEKWAKPEDGLLEARQRFGVKCDWVGIPLKFAAELRESHKEMVFGVPSPLVDENNDTHGSGYERTDEKQRGILYD